MTPTTDINAAIQRADNHSPFLHGLLQREAALVDLIRAQGFQSALDHALHRLDADDPARSLRTARQGVALTVALADLSGSWSLEQTTAALSHFADSAIEFALTAAFAERGQRPAGFAVLALGKLGSHELNYSSDIDLICVHDPKTLARRAQEDPAEAAVRIVRRMVALLADRTADGYAFRVDLRLRPDPESTPPSLPVSAAIGYYQSQALAWERAAFIRARACAGDLALGQGFLQEIQPFVWRRSLDYSALAEVREISSRIRNHYSARQLPGPGFDLKCGRGGIREVEFFAQVHQLIFGGRDPALRNGNTLQAIQALLAAEKISTNEAETLAHAYRFFRALEHRIQMLHDQQIHQIPETATERADLAALAGAGAWAEIEAVLLPHVEAVGKLYDDLLATGQNLAGPQLPLDAAGIHSWAAENRISDAPLLVSLASSWRSGRARSLRASAARTAFEAVVPRLVREIGGGSAGRTALLRFNRLIEALPSGVQFWRLLAANPGLQSTVARILTATPLLADALAQRPGLIDILLVPAPPLPDTDTAFAELAAAARDLQGEALLDRVRLWTAERRFQLGVQLTSASISPATAAREMAFMAEAAIAWLAASVMQDFSLQHGAVPGGRLIPLALGRLGGGELTAQSDLDLVFLFTGSFESQSTGPAPLSASAWFNRVGQRLISALSIATAAGPLYEVDTRLRPSGKNGLLVVSLDSFRRYQMAQAELWEHMALTRARAVAALPRDRQATDNVLDEILTRPRDAASIRQQVLAIRKHIETHKPQAGPFDLKMMRGGLVDIEFIVETRALVAGHRIPTALDAASRQMAPELEAPARLMMDMLVMLRLVQPHDAAAIPDAAAGAMIARACGHINLAALQAELDSARKIVLGCWAETFQDRPERN